MPLSTAECRRVPLSTTERHCRCISIVTSILGPVLHPEGRVRSVWNAVLALLIIYCGWAVRLLVATEYHMITTWLLHGCHVHVRVWRRATST